MDAYYRYLRQLRLEAQLSSRETDRRDPQDVLSWTRDRTKGKEPIMRSLTKAVIIAWTLWSLQGNELKQIVAMFTTQEACMEASFKLAFLLGQEMRCLGDYSLTRPVRS